MGGAEFWPARKYFLECVRFFGLGCWESLVRIEEGDSFGGHLKVGGGADESWEVGAELGHRGGSQPLSSVTSLWTFPAFVLILDVWSFSSPSQWLTIECFSRTPQRTPFLIRVTSPWPSIPTNQNLSVQFPILSENI